jgi:hypothetical protein
MSQHDDPYARLEALGVRTRRSNYAEVLLKRAHENGRRQEAELNPATTYLRQTQVHGAHGQFFDDSVELTALEPPYPRMRSIHVWSTGYGLLSLQVEYESGWCASKHGEVDESQASHDQFELREGEFLVAISGLYGTVINSLQFHTSSGRTSQLFGFEIDGLPFSVSVPQGRASVALTGRTYGQLSALGLVYLERADMMRSSKSHRSGGASPTLASNHKGHTPLPPPAFNTTYAPNRFGFQLCTKARSSPSPSFDKGPVRFPEKKSEIRPPPGAYNVPGSLSHQVSSAKPTRPHYSFGPGLNASLWRKEHVPEKGARHRTPGPVYNVMTASCGPQAKSTQLSEPSWKLSKSDRFAEAKRRLGGSATPGPGEYEGDVYY